MEFLTALFTFIQNYEEKKSNTFLWSIYITDFIKYKFILDPNYEVTCDEVKILMNELNFSPASDIPSRFFELHSRVAVDRLKLTRALPTIRSIRKYNTSNEVKIDSNDIVHILFKQLESCLNSEEPTEELLNSWYNSFIQIVSIQSKDIIVM